MCYDIFKKYSWIIPWKDEKGIAIINAFQNILDQCIRKANELQVDKGNEFYNRSMKSLL